MLAMLIIILLEIVPLFLFINWQYRDTFAVYNRVATYIMGRIGR